MYYIYIVKQYQNIKLKMSETSVKVLIWHTPCFEKKPNKYFLQHTNFITYNVFIKCLMLILDTLTSYEETDVEVVQLKYHLNFYRYVTFWLHF